MTTSVSTQTEAITACAGEVISKQQMGEGVEVMTL